MAPKKITATELNQIIHRTVKKGVPAFLKHGLSTPELREVEGNKADVFTFGRSYFYRGGADEDKFAIAIQAELKDKGYGCKVIAKGDNHHSFVGGAKSMSARDSFFWVTAIVRREVEDK